MDLKAELRTTTGTSAARRERREGKVPVTMYGKEGEATSLLVDRRDFDQLLKKEGSNAVFNLNFDDKTQQVWIKDFEFAALSDVLYNIDLEAISADQKLEVDIPLYIRNEEEVKEGIVELIEQTILVETTPGNIPQSFELDVKALEIGDILTVADITIPENVEVLMELDTTVVSVSAPSEEPEETDEDTEVAEPEVIGAKEDEEDEE